MTKIGLRIGAVLVAMLVAAGSATAGEDGLVLRALGIYQGKAEVSDEGIKCEIPTVTGAIVNNTFNMGLWNTYGFQTLFYPDINNPFANPCGGWLQVRNNLLTQGMTLEKVQVQYGIVGARRYRDQVPTRKGWPVQCARMKRQVIFTGAYMDAFGSDNSSSSSGAPNVAFAQLLPIVPTDVIHCLRDNYAPLPTSTFTNLPIKIRMVGVGRSDAGEVYRTNPVKFTLSLRHTCGNGRIDDGELCDPQGPSTCTGFCVIEQGSSIGDCSHNPDIKCRTDADCLGVCRDGNDPMECVCIY